MLRYRLLLVLLFAVTLLSSCAETASQPATTTPSAGATPTSASSSSPQSKTAANTPTDTVTKFYQALKDHRYDQAASYLAANMTMTDGKTLNKDLLKQMAQQREKSDGSINTIASGGTPAANEVVMTITRNMGPYHSHFICKQEGQQWKIVSLDRI